MDDEFFGFERFPNDPVQFFEMCVFISQKLIDFGVIHLWL